MTEVVIRAHQRMRSYNVTMRTTALGVTYHVFVHYTLPAFDTYQERTFHPFPPRPLSDNHFWSPFSRYPTSDVIQEQVSGTVVYEPDDFFADRASSEWDKDIYIPLTPGDYGFSWVPGPNSRVTPMLTFPSDPIDEQQFFLTKVTRVSQKVSSGKVVISAYGSAKAWTYEQYTHKWKTAGNWATVFISRRTSVPVSQFREYSTRSMPPEVDLAQLAGPTQWELDYDQQYEVQRANDPRSWGALCYEAGASIRSLDLNGLAFAKETLDAVKLLHSAAKGDVKKVLDVFQKPSSFREGAKTASKAYLATHYGLRLTLQDLDDLDDAVREMHRQKSAMQLYQRGYAEQRWSNDTLIAGTLVARTRSTSLIVRSFSDDVLHAADSIAAASEQFFDRVARAGYELDIMPSLSNLWDLVPFSFVLDWVSPIGDALEFEESKNYFHTLPIILVSYRDQWDWTVGPPQYPGWTSRGVLRHKIYKRVCSPTATPPTYVGSGSSFSSLSHHAVEASALLTSLIT